MYYIKNINIRVSENLENETEKKKKKAQQIQTKKEINREKISPSTKKNQIEKKKEKAPVQI